jgi:hypothetical protein
MSLPVLMSSRKRGHIAGLRKADGVQVFHDILTAGNDIAAAYAAKVHIPSDLFRK